MSEAKIVVLLGSPRKKGNSTLLAKEAVRGAIAESGKCETFYLQGMNIQPCRACDSCQQDEQHACVLKDDMQLLYPKILDATALLFATPIYWFSISAQTKIFLDRCYALNRPEGHLFKGKKVGVILTYGDRDPYVSGAVNAIRTLQDSFRYTESDIVGIVYGSANKAGEVLTNKRLLSEAYNLGKKMAG